jgi:hypothetical protein
MDKLLALPVAGDSYLLDLHGRKILVDGGHSSRSLRTALSSPNVAVTELDIVVCTHADADHAGGLVDLLDKGGIRVGEFWLPGAWGDALPELLRQPRAVVDSLVTEMDEVSTRSAEAPDIQDDEDFEADIGANIAAQRRSLAMENPREVTARDHGNERVLGIRWLRELLPDDQLNEEGDLAAAKEFERGRRLIRQRAIIKKFNAQQRSMWVSAIKTAERIRRIAIQAIRHDVVVRWFDFGEFAKTRLASGGDARLLVPLNSVELAFPPPPIATMKYLARLTPVNEECLVFMSVHELPWPKGIDVVFTGDSPLGDGVGYGRSFLHSYRWNMRPVVATAPHHGSESNSIAYRHLQDFAPIAFWLRSGGSPKHPGPTFRSLLESDRICTSCPHKKLERRLAVVQLSPPPWSPLVLRTNGHVCNCK